MIILSFFFLPTLFLPFTIMISFGKFAEVSVFEREKSVTDQRIMNFITIVIKIGPATTHGRKHTAQHHARAHTHTHPPTPTHTHTPPHTPTHPSTYTFTHLHPYSPIPPAGRRGADRRTGRARAGLRGRGAGQGPTPPRAGLPLPPF